MPRSAREFSVYLQAKRVLDVKCTDKFLFQSTIVSAGTTDAEITSSLFSKDDGKHIEEQKLRVIIMSSLDSDSHILSPIKVDLNQGQGHESIYDQVLGGVEKLMYSRDLSLSSLKY